MGNLGAYETLTTAAKAVGGPEALLRQYYRCGVRSQYPLILLAGLGGLAIGAALTYSLEPQYNKLVVPEEDVQVIRDAMAEDPAPDNEPSLDELKERLESLKQNGTSGSDMDIVTQYVDLFGLSEEDTSIIRKVKERPDYPEYAERFLQVVPDAEELDVVRAYIEWIRPFEGDDIYR